MQIFICCNFLKGDIFHDFRSLWQAKKSEIRQIPVPKLVSFKIIKVLLRHVDWKTNTHTEQRRADRKLKRKITRVVPISKQYWEPRTFREKKRSSISNPIENEPVNVVRCCQDATAKCIWLSNYWQQRMIGKGNCKIIRQCLEETCCRCTCFGP